MIDDILRTKKALEIMRIPTRLTILEQRDWGFFKAAGIRTINGQGPDGQGNIDITTPALGFTLGSVLFVGSDGSFDEDNANFFWNNTLNYFGVGTSSPASQINISGSISATSWTTRGLRLATEAGTLTDTTGSGTIGTRVAVSLGTPTFASSGSVTVTNGANLYIPAAPSAGTGTGITNPLAIFVDSGNVRLDGQLSVGFSGAPVAVVDFGATLSASAWTSSGIAMRSRSTTYTDTSSSGTVSTNTANSFLTPAFAASSTVTYTNASTLYVSAAPTVGTNVTITAAWALHINSGNSWFNGKVFIGNNGGGQANIRPLLSLNGDVSSGVAFGVVGIRLSSGNRTYTDTVSSGTVASVALDGFSTGTLAASSAVTYTTAATVYIANAPTVGSNVSITNGHALWIDAGTSRFDGNVTIGGTVFGASATAELAMVNGTAPSGNITDGFQLYSADQTAGNAVPTFRTENGTIISLYQVATYTISNVTTDRSYDANLTSVDEVADALGTLVADLRSLGVLA